MYKEEIILILHKSSIKSKRREYYLIYFTRPANWLQQYINRILSIHHSQKDTCPRNIVNIIHHINRLRKKSHVIILISRKSVSQKSNPFLIKTLNAVEIIGKFLNLIKGIYETRTISTIFHGRKIKCFPWGSESK